MLIESPPAKNEEKAEVGYHAILGLLVVSYLTSNFLVFLGAVVCLFACTRPYNVWTKLTILLWAFYILSLGVTAISVGAFLVNSAIYGISQATFKEHQVHFEFYHWDVVIVIVGLLGLVLNILQAGLVVVAYKSVLEMYDSPETESLMSTQASRETSQPIEVLGRQRNVYEAPTVKDFLETQGKGTTKTTP